MGQKPILSEKLLQQFNNPDNYNDQSGYDSKLLPMDSKNVKNINIETIIPNPYQPRKTFNEKEIIELASNIKENRLLQPIVVYEEIPNEKYVLISGERRLRAFKYLKKETGNILYNTISAVIETKPKNEQEFKSKLMFLGLSENISRKDLTPVEKAESIKQIQQQTKMTYGQIASKLGLSEQTIKNLMYLNNQLNDEQKKKVIENKLGKDEIKKLINESKPTIKEVSHTPMNQFQKLETLLKKQLNINTNMELKKFLERFIFEYLNKKNEEN